MQEQRKLIDQFVQQAADVDDDEVAAAWSASSTKRALFDVIRKRATGASGSNEGSRRHPRIQSWRIAAALVAVLALFAVLGPALLTDDPLRGALAIRRHGETVTVAVQDASADPQQLQQELRAAGLDVRIRTIPAAPAAVGTWLRASFDEGFPGEAADAITQQIGRTLSIVELPSEFPGGLTLFVGREAVAGEEAEGGVANLLAEGPLHCLRLDTLPFEQVEAMLADKGYQTIWVEERTTDKDDSSGAMAGEAIEVDGPPSGSRGLALYEASFRAPDTVDLRVMDPDDPVFGLVRWSGWPNYLRSENPEDRYQDCGNE